MKTPNRAYSRFRLAICSLASVLLLLGATVTHADNSVLSFDVSGDYVTTPGKITTLNFTAEAWVKPTTYQYENQVLSQYAGGGGRMIIAVRDSKAGLFVGGTWVTGNGTLPLNTWTHIAITRNGSAWSFYVNGVFDSTKTGNANTLDNTTLRIGRIVNTSGTGFRGEISDVRVWNAVRTAPQILAAYNTRLSGTESGLIYYWPLDEGTGTTVTDLVAAANGTITGAAWISEIGPPFVDPGLPVGAWNVPVGGNWSESANWLDAVIASGNGGTAFFTNQPPSAVTITNDMTGLLLGQFNINSASAHTFTGNAITLTNANLLSLISATTGDHTFALPLSTTALGLSLFTQSGASLTMGDVISGPGSISINPVSSGGGSISLTAANTYTGSTTLGSGTFVTDTLANGGVASPLGSSSSEASNLTLGPGTLRYTGGTATTDRGYTVAAGSKASILDTDADITFGGQIAATSGAFVKTGSGTVTYTYPGLNTHVVYEGNPNALINIGANGDSPTTGFSGLTILDGKLVFGVAGQTNIFNNRIDIGLYSTTNAGEETSAELEINGGTFICTTTLSIGRNNGNTNTAPDGTTSKLTINGGECYLALVASGYNALAQTGFNPRSIYEINGGYVEQSSSCNMGEVAGSRISMNVNGGHLKVNASGASIRLGAGTGEGTLNMANDALVEAAGYIGLALNAGTESRGTCNLNGGTLIASDIKKGSGDSGVVNFNGGIFKPHTAGEVLDGLTAANVSAHGALIDTSLASYSITQNLLHDAGLGGSADGGLIKLGNNTLTLACAAPDYTGPTIVSNGTLAVTGALPAANDVIVAPGANLTAGGAADQTLAVGSLTLEGDGMLTFTFLPDGTANDTVDAASSPSLGNGQIALERADNAMPFTLNGTYTLLTYSGADPATVGLTIANPVFGKTYSFSATGGALTVTIATDTAGASVWNVDSGGAWSTSGNWTVSPSGTAGSLVRFDDAISSPASVTTAGETVGGIYFNNANAYTLAGTGLTLDNDGADALLWVERGAHTLSAPLTLAGDAVVTLPAGAGLSLGSVSGASSALKAQGDGTLTLTTDPAVQSLSLDVSKLDVAASMTVSPPASLLRTVTVNPATDAAVTLDGALSGSGGLTKAGSSTLLPASANSYTGPTTVSGGTLAVAALANGGTSSPIGASSAASGNLILGKATLHVTGSGVSDRGYTVRTIDTSRAAVLRADGDITFGGQILADSGPFLKTGPGTVTYTYPGPNKLNAHEVGGAGGLQNIGVNGDGPSAGVTGFTVTQGKVILGAPGQTNTIVGHLDVGLYTTTAAGQETAGELVLNDGVLTCNNTVSVGRNNGTSVTAGPTGVSSRITVNGGIFNTLTLASGNNGANLSGFNARPIIEVTGGRVNVGGAYLSVGESPGSSASLLVSGGTVNIYPASSTLRIGGWTGTGGDGRVVLSGTGVITVASNVEVGFGTGSHSFLCLDGGSLTARNILGGAGTQKEVWFNGGLFRPNTTNQTMSGLTSALVSTNGAWFDTTLADGFTIAQALLSDPALGGAPDGGLVKLGTNSLSLTGAGSTFNGPIIVSEGLLRALVGATNDLFLAAGAAFDALGQRASVGDLTGTGLLTNGVLAVTGTLDAGTNGAPAGASMTVENLSLVAGSIVACDWSTNALGQVTNDFVAVTGTLAPEGAGFIDLGRTEANPIPMPLEVTLMSYGTVSGTFAGWKAINTGLPPNRAIATTVAAANGLVTVKVQYSGTMIFIR